MEWTYFIQADGGGPIKIGTTCQEPEKRLANLQTGSPVVLRIVGLIHGNVERQLHDAFAKFRIHGEWFEASDELIQYVCKHGKTQACARAAEVKALELEGSAIRLNELNDGFLGDSFYEQVIENDDFGTLMDLLDLDWETMCCECGDDLAQSDECLCQQMACELDCIWQLIEIVDNEKFFERIGVNMQARLVGIACGACNSQRRFELLNALGDVAVQMDSVSDLFLFATFFDKGKQIGINLFRLGLVGTENNAHIFDPTILLKNLAKQ